MKSLLLKYGNSLKANNTTDYKKIAAKAGVIIFRYAMLIAVGYTVLSPLFQIISNSLKSDADFMNTSVNWIPTTAFFQNYIDAFNVMEYGKSLLNTLLIPVMSGLLQVVSCGVVAYGFARFKFPEKKIIYPIHNSKFTIDESALKTGVAVMSQLAIEYLNGGTKYESSTHCF